MQIQNIQSFKSNPRASFGIGSINSSKIITPESIAQKALIEQIEGLAANKREIAASMLNSHSSNPCLMDIFKALQEVQNKLLEIAQKHNIKLPESCVKASTEI